MARAAALCALALVAAAALMATVPLGAAAATDAPKAPSKFECMACTIVLGLLMEKPAANATRIKGGGPVAPGTAATATLLADAAAAQVACGGDSACLAFVRSQGAVLARALAAGSSPDQVCISLKMCDGQCTLFNSWPVAAPAPRPPPTKPTHGFSDDDATEAEAVAAAYGSAAEPLEADGSGAMDLDYGSGSSAGDVAADTSEYATAAEAYGSAAMEAVAATPATADGMTAAEALRRVSSILGTLGSRDFAEAAAAAPEGYYGLMTTVMTAMSVAAQRAEGVVPMIGTSPDPCGWNITCIVHRVFSQHLPLNDADGDTFPPSGSDNGFRGADWRGRDCNDTDPNIRPGRASSQEGEDPNIDHNCNGISGVDPTTGKSYEEMWCKGQDTRGITILGDSAAAHFNIPPSYLRHQKWSLKGLVPFAEDEADWPQCSWATGYVNSSDCLPSALPMKSIYQRLRNHNLCSHRDFANIGVNGARTGAMMPDGHGGGIIESFQRDQQHDNPVVTVFALIGNDVCNGHLPDTIAHMTTPAEFHTNVIASLEYLDTVLPSGSTVIIIPLVDGRVLWDIMHEQIHPLGVPYPDVYGFLNCYTTNPCSGWLNSNATLRNATTARAQELNAVYSTIVAANATAYKHFNIVYENLSWETFIQTYVSDGGNAVDIIAQIDGFHPSQTGHQLMAYNVWKLLKEKHPEVIGKPNPNNAAILAKFGDQGGYN